MHFDCDVVEDLLPAYLGEKTSDATNRLVGEHLSSCEHCQAVLGQLRAAQTHPKGEPDYPRLLRRRRMVILVLSFALTLSIAIACLLGLAQSDGYQQVDVLRAQDFFTGSLLELPLSFDKGLPDGEQTTLFFSEEDAPSLAARIEQLQSDVKPQVFGEYAVLLTQPQGDGSHRQYLLRRSQAQPIWQFSGMGAQFEKRTAEGIIERSVAIIFPYHLIEDERMADSRRLYELEENYRAAYGMEEFLAFYRALERYQIQQVEDGFVIQGYSDPQADYQVADFPVSFQFGELGGQNYISVHYS